MANFREEKPRGFVRLENCFGALRLKFDFFKRKKGRDEKKSKNSED